jgi:hypothetical protein
MLVDKIKQVKPQSMQIFEDDKIQIRVDDFDFEEFNLINDHVESIIL